MGVSYHAMGGDYRDGDQAARARLRVLEEELAESEAEGEAQRAEIERQQLELRAKDAELARLRSAAPSRATPTTDVRSCPQCRAQNAPHYRFCLSCGADLSQEAVVTQPVRTTATRTTNRVFFRAFAVFMAVWVMVLCFILGILLLGRLHLLPF